MGMNLSQIMNKILPIKLTNKEAKVTTFTNVNAPVGVAIALAVINSTDAYTIAKVALKVSTTGKYKLYAQHKNALGDDVGVTESQDKTGASLFLKAQKRSTKTEIYFRNIGTTDVTFSADITLSVDFEDSSFILSGNNEEFRRRGDSSTGSAYARLYADATNPVSDTAPLPIKTIGGTKKNTSTQKLRNVVVAAGTTIGLVGVEETSDFNTARVTVNQGVANACQLYAQHTDDVGNDYGTTEPDGKSQNIVTLRVTKRSSKMSIIYRNNGASPVTINADIILSTEMSTDNNVMAGESQDFRNRGDAKTGAMYTRLYVDGLNPVSNTNPLPIANQSSVLADKYGSSGTKLALSVEEDTNGQGVLRVVDASPIAYNSQKDALQVIERNQNWTLTNTTTDSTLTLTKIAEPTRYHVCRGITVSANLQTSVLNWILKSATNVISQGFVHGSGVINIPIKIGDGCALSLIITNTTADSSIISITLIGETMEV